MNIFEITDQVRTNEDAIQFLRDRGILRSLDNPPICDVCGEAMHIARRANIGDGVRWKCERRIGGIRHKRTQFIRHGSFLENSNLELKQFVFRTIYFLKNKNLIKKIDKPMLVCKCI